MSAASRQRERERRQTSLEQRYGPFPDPGVAPPPLDQRDPELARLMGWFCSQHGEIADTLDAEDVIVTDDDGGQTFVVPKPKSPAPPSQVDVTMAAIMAMVGGVPGKRK